MFRPLYLSNTTTTTNQRHILERCRSCWSGVRYVVSGQLFSDWSLRSQLKLFYCICITLTLKHQPESGYRALFWQIVLTLARCCFHLFLLHRALEHLNLVFWYCSSSSRQSHIIDLEMSFLRLEMQIWFQLSFSKIRKESPSILLYI